MSLLPKIRVVGKTDVGLVRTGNEDYLHLDEEHKVYAVCDGMGGHQAGEVASMTASETIERAFEFFSRELLDDAALGIDRVVPPSGDLLLRSVRLANRAVYTKATEDSRLSGMGTTVVALAFEADIVSVAHVGDSRAYRLGERELEPLTKDHSWLVEMQELQNISEEEASALVAKNVITRALGVKGTVEVDYRLVRVHMGDIFILCSDGLCGFADDEEIFDVATKGRDDIDKMAGDLVQMANDRGGSDNVTIIVAQVDELKESELPELEVFTLGSESQETLEVEDRWVDKLAEIGNEPERIEQGSDSRGKPSRLLVSGIFLVFVIVAVLIIYYSQAG